MLVTSKPTLSKHEKGNLYQSLALALLTDLKWCNRCRYLHDATLTARERVEFTTDISGNCCVTWAVQHPWSLPEWWRYLLSKCSGHERRFGRRDWDTSKETCGCRGEEVGSGGCGRECMTNQEQSRTTSTSHDDLDLDPIRFISTCSSQLEPCESIHTI